MSTAASTPAAPNSNPRVAVVTGARRGIGRAISLALAGHGWDIVVVDHIDDEETARTRQLLDGLGVRHSFRQADISDAAKAATLAEDCWAAFGQVDALVNNAGVQVQDRAIDVLDTPLESYDRLMGINLRGTFFVSQAFARLMVARPAPAERFRSIVTISSSSAQHARTQNAEYCLSKASLTMMNRLLALRLANSGIACYEVQPGLIKTDMNQAIHTSYDRLVREGAVSPVRRWGQPEDVGQVVATLANGGLPFCTGETLHVDGGLHIPKASLENPIVRAAFH
jgi:3-oxoacyl-[acyl-carrier protein] reductase